MRVQWWKEGGEPALEKVEMEVLRERKEKAKVQWWIREVPDAPSRFFHVFDTLTNAAMADHAGGSQSKIKSIMR